MSDLLICNVECDFKKDVIPNPFSEVVVFDMVLRVRAVAARSDFSAAKRMFRERANALVESIKKDGAR